MQKLLRQEFYFNPFSGVLDEDLDKTIVPRFNLEGILKKINGSKPQAIEFLGKQGRGKTTHLVYLQKQISQYPIFKLNANSDFSEVINSPSETLFIDSIHHFNLMERVKLFKSKRVVIYTTHWNRKLDCLLAQKKYYSINFNSINTELLSSIINRRIQLALKEKCENEFIKHDEIKGLVKRFGDDYRGIINHLFSRYQ